MRHGSRKRRKTTLRIYLYLYNSLHKSDSRGNGNIASARAGYKHAGENVCRQKFIQRKTTWLWSGPVDLLTVSSLQAAILWFPSNCPRQRRDHRLRWSSRCSKIYQRFSKVLRFLNGTIVENVRDERNPKGGNLCNDATIQRKMKFSIESGSL